MILSFWRSSHILLSITSAIFLIIASVTGAILALEPISDSSKAYHVVDIKDVSTATTITQLKKKYNEILSIEVTANNDVIASVITTEGKSQDLYINPLTGNKLGAVKERNPIFIWTTNLHRSLFLKSIGRFFIGFTSLLLCFIALTGMFLLAQRQGSFLKLYNKVKEQDFNQRYHVILGRWLLIPIIVIAITGAYLSVITFDLIPETTVEHNWDKEPTLSESSNQISEVVFFQELMLDKVRKISFPFSEDELDYFEISLQNRDLLVHQYTGEVMSELEHPFSSILSRWSYHLHTGTGSVLWSLVLLITSASILFFIFSGFAMFLKRRRKTKTTLTLANKDKSEIVILVGSESGNTYAFAKTVAKQLSDQGRSVFLSSLNEYTSYEKATHLLVLTATYGDGDAPTNARHFLDKLSKIKQDNSIQFSVLGFGSMDYEHYCRFAIQVDTRLQQQEGFTPLLPLQKINEQSEEQINDWLKNWSAAIGVTNLKHEDKEHKFESFKVIQRSSLNKDDTFILKLKYDGNNSFQSGDILHILAPEIENPRAYSIARIGNHILLSIKKHDKGICSSYLSDLNIDDSITASIKHNPSFHLPLKTKSVIFISNGTGIAPFLGMINKKKPRKQAQYFFWGGRFNESFELYQPFIENGKNNLSVCQLSSSREQQKKYIQDEIWDRRNLIAESLENGGHIMICGSIAMKDDLLIILDKITEQNLKTPLINFELKGQILIDCY